MRLAETIIDLMETQESSWVIQNGNINMIQAINIEVAFRAMQTEEISYMGFVFYADKPVTEYVLRDNVKPSKFRSNH